MGWVTFKGRNKRAPGELGVTLSKSGNIGLNASVLKAIGDAKYAVFMFDMDRNRIGIKFSKHTGPDAYPIHTAPRGNHGTLAGVSFMKTYGIFPSETKNYPATFDEGDKMIVVDLAKNLAETNNGKGNAQSTSKTRKEN